MRKIIVLTFLSLDGIMQAPGGPTEDTSGGFKYGGWTVPYFDDFGEKVMEKQMAGKYDLLLGRKTFEIFASYWPNHTDGWSQVNKITKYVVSKTLRTSEWENSVFLKNVRDVIKLKEMDGPPLQVYGSGDLVQTLMKHELVDEFWLKIFPITLGKGKKLFAEGTAPSSFKLTESKISPSGVIIASYTRYGDVKTGSF